MTGYQENSHGIIGSRIFSCFNALKLLISRLGKKETTYEILSFSLIYDFSAYYRHIYGNIDNGFSRHCEDILS